MKTQTRRMKPIFSTVLLLLLAALLLVSCNHTVEMPSDDTLRQIKLDYGCHVFGENYDPAAHGDGSGSKCYGIYNGCVPMYFDGYALCYATVITREKIAGVVFEYGSSNTIQVWKDGKIYTLQEAYVQGFLSKQDIKTIASMRKQKKFKL